MKIQTYSDLEKYLHNEFLGDTEISNFLFNRIKKVRKNRIQTFKVFICGLARSGTTTLLNQIYNTNEIASLKYCHMPFVLNPRLSNIFEIISKRKLYFEKERLHGDGIKISPQSPECLDEPFWIKENPNYYDSPISNSRILSKKALISYRNFLDMHAKFQKKNKIVIKNNNHHVRIKYLSEYFKNDLFFILYRDPLSQAISLDKTHRRICKAQNKEPFITKYMNLIGHREFGLNQLPFHYLDSELEISRVFDEKDQLNYWIKVWINAYEWIYKFVRTKKTNNVYLVSYEELCNSNNKIINLILKKSNLKNKVDIFLKNKNSNCKKLKVDDLLLNKANSLYLNLRKIESFE